MSLNQQEKLALAAAVIDLGKRLTPDRFPNPTEENIQEWAHVLGSINVPPEVWLDAVRLWATELVGEKMVTPRELKDAARTVIGRWESDPVMKRKLDERRERLRDERDRQLKAGTFGSARGYKPLEAPEKESVTPPEMLSQLRASLARKKGVS